MADLSSPGFARLLLLGAYAVLSVASFVIYGMDKAAAERGSRRTPEITLHLMSLFGGWPGALVGQRVFRHKTRKQPFRTIFWCTVLANCLALALMLAVSSTHLGPLTRDRSVWHSARDTISHVNAAARVSSDTSQETA